MRNSNEHEPNGFIVLFDCGWWGFIKAAVAALVFGVLLVFLLMLLMSCGGGTECNELVRKAETKAILDMQKYYADRMEETLRWREAYMECQDKLYQCGCVEE